MILIPIIAALIITYTSIDERSPSLSSEEIYKIKKVEHERKNKAP